MGENKTIWAFDLGTGSIGEAVRDGTKFLHKASLLIPDNFAETKTAAGRRRMWRTRLAHLAREAWLDEVMLKAGIEPLKGRRTVKIDGKWQAAPETEDGKRNHERLEREFAEPGDATCYTSCLLRIKLMRGEKLEPWQVYKALHSAIQRRGYDPHIPWKTRIRNKAKAADSNDDEAGTQVRMEEFERQLEEMTPGKPEFQFPCYFDAWKMGLWNPSDPMQLKSRIDCRAESTRNQIVPRKRVEKEIRALVDAAAKYYPTLGGKADYLLYGPAKTAYASFDGKLRKQHNLKESGANDWQGVVGQKIPRFDNRIIGKCVLIPRLNVCKVRTGEKGDLHPQSRIAAETVFLMRLKNMRFQTADGQRGLTAQEINTVFNDPKRRKLALTETAWKRLCLRFGGKPLLGQFQEIKEPSFSGRSRFCRPSLEILKRLILSGDAPQVAHEKEMARLRGNTDPLKGLVQEDLNFLLQMGTTWDGIYIPNQKLDALAHSTGDAHEAIRELIGTQNNPVVRHRLTLFAERLDKLAEKFGVPESVVLEFVREDFMGKKARMEYFKFQRDRAAQRTKAREQARTFGAEERSSGLKMELLTAQVGECLYTGEKLIPEELDQYVIDHVVPRAKGGPDSVLNYILTTRRANDDKGDRTPFEWLSAKGGWDAYVNRVKGRIGTLRNKKVQLLISAEAENLVQRYTSLAETAWISKLAQTIIGLRFGWPGGISSGERKVTVVSGGLTGRIRRKYKLNSLLNPESKSEEEAEMKNRKDHRHHALDAMVISFIPGWARNAKFSGFFRFPDGVDRELFGREIADVTPQALCFEKTTLAETIYGARGEGASKVIVQRAEVVNFAQKPIAPDKTKFDLAYAQKQIESIRDAHIKKELAEFLSTKPSELAWNAFCQSFCLRQKDGSCGSPIKFVRVNVGEATEYKDLSKDGTGAFRKAVKGHKGQIVFLDKKGKLRVRPIYAFESVRTVQRDLTASCDCQAVKGFFQSGCLIELASPIAHRSTPLAPGRYKLNTMRTDGYVTLTDSAGKISLPISLEKMIAAGFTRLD
ncbi:MAG: type II CRISPR RNA-guided endonuclease Cas9 [Verrucomicrobiota bacterium]|jgi:CRISPR-associated endonuclease Csn1